MLVTRYSHGRETLLVVGHGNAVNMVGALDLPDFRDCQGSCVDCRAVDARDACFLVKSLACDLVTVRAELSGAAFLC